ncbi:MAG: hypothetical protein ACKOC5_03720 [Chloroflexota bacterium]
MIKQRLLTWCLAAVLLLSACGGGLPGPDRPAVSLPEQPISGLTPTTDKGLGLEPAGGAAAPTLDAAPGAPVSPTQPGALPTATRPTVTLPAFPLPGMELESISQQALDLSIQAGAYWIRRNMLDWSLVEPVEGQRDWSALTGLETEMQRVAQAGGQLVLVVRGAPDWAQEKTGVWCGPIMGEKLPAFAAFLQEAVTRYSAAPYNVKYWEIGNEPDIDPKLVDPKSPYGCMGNRKNEYYGGGEYAELLKAAYPAVKAANPQAQVLVGGLLLDCDPVSPPEGSDCTPALYLEGALRAGAGDFFDGVSFHAYDRYLEAYKYHNPNWHAAWNSSGPALVPKTRYLRSVLNVYGYPQKYLLNTESGLICGQTGAEPYCQDDAFILTKSYYLAHVNVAARAEGLRGNLWYSLSGWRGTGLLDSQGAPNRAYEAYKFTASMLQGVGFVREINDYPGVRVYELANSERIVWFLITADGLEHTLLLPTQPTDAYDVFGAAVPAEGTQIPIGWAPLFLEFAP